MEKVGKIYHGPMDGLGYTLPETNIAPEFLHVGLLEDDFSFQNGPFSC